MMNNNFFVLCKKLADLCVKQSVHIALAESCTGGSVAAHITELPGSSRWFNGCAVVYSNLAKRHLLGIDEQLMKQHGVVSEVVAAAMAQGALKIFQADLALSITGVAGPGGGSAEKPVGMVCFALADHKSVLTKTMHFTSGREYIRECASVFALEWLTMHLSIR